MNHSPFIHRCLELAENGRGHVKTNPLVGCVIVQGGAVITEGWHVKYGEEHAEVMALRKAGDLARGATLYVNLEPCCKHGKQPPCTEAIINAGITTVVFGARDPSNNGSKILMKHKIKIIGPITVETRRGRVSEQIKEIYWNAMEAQCRRFNKGFFSLIEQGRPYVTLKKAMRKDGLIDGKITNKEQDEWSHTRLRATHDAILVGAETVIADDPQLTNRLQTKKLINQKTNKHTQPRRIILDPHSKTPQTAKILTDNDANRTIIIREKLPIPGLLDRLKEEGISSVLVEGGPSVWKSFEESGYLDEIVILSGK